MKRVGNRDFYLCSSAKRYLHNAVTQLPRLAQFLSATDSKHGAPGRSTVIRFFNESGFQIWQNHGLGHPVLAYRECANRRGNMVVLCSSYNGRASALPLCLSRKSRLSVSVGPVNYDIGAEKWLVAMAAAAMASFDEALGLQVRPYPCHVVIYTYSGIGVDDAAMHRHLKGFRLGSGEKYIVNLDRLFAAATGGETYMVPSKETASVRNLGLLEGKPANERLRASREGRAFQLAWNQVVVSCETELLSASNLATSLRSNPLDTDSGKALVLGTAILSLVIEMLPWFEILPPPIDEEVAGSASR
jgi:hypothetical protein